MPRATIESSTKRQLREIRSLLKSTSATDSHELARLMRLESALERKLATLQENKRTSGYLEDLERQLKLTPQPADGSPIQLNDQAAEIYRLLLEKPQGPATLKAFLNEQ